MVIRNTDILNYNTRIAISYGAYYDPNKLARNIGQQNARIASIAYNSLKTKLDLPENIWIRLAGIKSGRITRMTGRYWSSHSIAEVDYRQSPRSFLEILCHELIHADQYKTGRLSWKKEGKKFVNCWNGEPVIIDYRNQPWEIEAYERQVILADELIKENPELLR